MPPTLRLEQLRDHPQVASVSSTERSLVDLFPTSVGPSETLAVLLMNLSDYTVLVGRVQLLDRAGLHELQLHGGNPL